MTWKQAGRLFDTFGLIALFLAFMFVSTRACGEELPEPLRAIDARWHGDASKIDGGNAVPVLFANAEAEYVLYSSPQRPMLYEVSHYRVRPTRRTGLFAGHAYPGDEAVYWMDHQLAGKPHAPRVFVKRTHRRWWSLWLLPLRRWEEVPVGSTRWAQEHRVVLRLWSVHALTRAYGRDAGTQEF